MTSQKRTYYSRIAVAILAVVGVFLLGFGSALELTANGYSFGVTRKVNLNLFWSVWNQVHDQYAGTVDDQKLMYGAIRGMVAGLGDPYSEFFDPTEAKNFQESFQGQFSGIGIEIGMQNGALTVIAPLDGTPAKAAGLASGDIILKIDGKDTSDLSLSDAVSKIRGPQGTSVTLSILAKADGAIKDVVVKRDVIHIDSVKWQIKDNNIGYVRISQFNDDTTSLMTKAVQEFKDKNVKGVVLDLRDNPGGFLDGARDVTSLFVQNGVVVSEQGKDGQKNDLYTTRDPLLPTTPLMILVNGGSASASEIVSGAIQDKGRGKLLGEKTFGKGSVQAQKSLPDGSSIKITIAKWLTPNGRMINGQGIKPDIELKQSADDTKAGKDTQLNKALDLLKGN